MMKYITLYSVLFLTFFISSCAERDLRCAAVDENGKPLNNTGACMDCSSVDANGTPTNPACNCSVYNEELKKTVFLECSQCQAGECESVGDMGVNDMGDMGADTTQTTCDPDCGDGKVCKTDGFVCVACVEDSNCTDQVCDTDSNTCVDCKDNSLCTEIAASLCDKGTCGACVMNEDCAHLEGTPRCDGGTCAVECEDDTHCGGKVCDVTTNTCTTLDPGMGTQCESCVSDTQCENGFSCIPLGFGDPEAPRGNYCLQVRPNTGGCAQPWQVDIRRESVNGNAAARHCGVNEKETTCEAVLMAIESVVSCDTAGASDPSKCLQDAGARCEDLSGGWTCTYGCDEGSQCTSTKTCVGLEYCG